MSELTPLPSRFPKRENAAGAASVPLNFVPGTVAPLAGRPEITRLLNTPVSRAPYAPSSGVSITQVGRNLNAPVSRVSDAQISHASSAQISRVSNAQISHASSVPINRYTCRLISATSPIPSTKLPNSIGTFSGSFVRAFAPHPFFLLCPACQRCNNATFRNSRHVAFCSYPSSASFTSFASGLFSTRVLRKKSPKSSSINKTSKIGRHTCASDQDAHPEAEQREAEGSRRSLVPSFAACHSSLIKTESIHFTP